MGGRSALGQADLPDEELARLVARQLGAAEADVLESRAEVAPYDLEALTTAGRYRVTGRARTADGEREFAFYVKVVQSWARTPAFAFVPEEVRENALAGLAWWIEPEVYRSDLRDRLPDGLTMPAAYDVVDLDEDSAALWLEVVQHRAEPWGLPQFTHAARLLGRFAASERVRAVNGTGRGADADRRVRDYAEGRVRHQVVPALHDAAVWDHPLVADAFSRELRDRLLAAADAVPDLVDEMERAPVATLHGDACSRNLLVVQPCERVAVIDFGFFGRGPVGFDLGQLLIGEVQTGERSAQCLPALEQACVPAYVQGLRDEGSDVDEDVVRRAHALQLLLFSGLSGVPFEHLGSPPTPQLSALAAERAQAVAFALDLVDATA